MPCPVFYPLSEVTERTLAGGRLPLIDEYAGICKAESLPHTPDRAIMFRACNHGYTPDLCCRLSLASPQSCIRYSITGRTDTHLELICVEETDYEPLRWHSIRYLLDRAELEGDIPTECIRAQALAFCRSYLRRFVAAPI